MRDDLASALALGQGQLELEQLATVQADASLLRIALPPEVAAVFLGSFHTTALENHSGLMAPIPAEMFGIKAENRAWVDRRCVGQPLATFEMPLLLTGAGVRWLAGRWVAMKLVVACPSRNTGCARHCAKKCRLLAMPSKWHSCSARASLRRASKRVVPWAMILASIES